MNEVKLLLPYRTANQRCNQGNNHSIWDSEEWETEIKTKSSLKMYIQYKRKIEEDIYDNRPSSTIRFRARTDTLQLNARNRNRYKEVHREYCGNLEQKERMLRTTTIQYFHIVTGSVVIKSTNNKPQLYHIRVQVLIAFND